LAGQPVSVLTLRPLIDMPEGIAIDNRGHIFVGNRRLENDLRVSEILEIANDGSVTTFVTLDRGAADDFATGILGLAFGPNGDLYAALASFNARTHGVWRISRDGDAERLPGSRRMVLPDALVSDAKGNLYVTDAGDGAVWRFPRGGPGKLWIRHALLEAPGIGANGIAFVPPRDLYVANTDQALIARIRIGKDGSAMEPEVVAAGTELLTVDGIVADHTGILHAVIAGASFFGIAPLVRIDPATGKVEPSTTEFDAFDFPTSLALGQGPLDHKSVHVVNSGIFPEGRPEAAPGVVRVRVK